MGLAGVNRDLPYMQAQIWAETSRMSAVSPDLALFLQMTAQQKNGR
jgi:hypothetical protein